MKKDELSMKECYLKGIDFVNYSQREDWANYVKKSFDGVLHGYDVNVMLDLIEFLDNKDFKGAKDLIWDYQISETCYYSVLSNLARFHKNGVDFAFFMEPHLEQNPLKRDDFKCWEEQHNYERNLAEKVAEHLHSDWRKTRLKPDGTYEPRWKTIKDRKFIEKLDNKNLPANIRITENGYEIDIANSEYKDLSPDWQKENYEAGKVVAGLVIRNRTENLSYNDVGNEIHKEWLRRNTWAKNDEILSKPFEELPLEEKEKDVDQFRVARKISNKMIGQEVENTL